MKTQKEETFYITLEQNPHVAEELIGLTSHSLCVHQVFAKRMSR